MKSAEEIYTIYDGWIETLHGTFDPQQMEFDIRDIAHGLGHVCRYNGQCKRFYSVAEHSILVSQLMEDLDLGDPFEGLMHDGEEAYVPDMPAPFKQFLPDFRRFSGDINAAVRKRFGLGEKKTDGCKKADWLALFIEANQIMTFKGENYSDPEDLRREALKLAPIYEISCHKPKDAGRLFLARFAELTAARLRTGR